MRNLLALIGAAVVTVLGLGWYLDWFHVKQSTAVQGTKSYNVEVDTSKIGTDLHKGGEKLHNLLDKHGEKKPEETSPKEKVELPLEPPNPLPGPPVPPPPSPE